MFLALAIGIAQTLFLISSSPSHLFYSCSSVHPHSPPWLAEGEGRVWWSNQTVPGHITSFKMPGADKQASYGHSYTGQILKCGKLAH